MDRHLSESETALQALRVALQDLEGAATEYRARRRAPRGGQIPPSEPQTADAGAPHPMDSGKPGRTPLPEPQAAWGRFLDLAREAWWRLTLRRRD